MEIKKCICPIYSGLFFFIFLQLFPVNAYSQDVAAVISDDYKIYSTVLEEFKATSKATVREYWMHGSIEEGKRIIERIKAHPPKLIFTIGTKATQIAKNIFDTPIVFSMVINPAQYDLSQSNICGISLNVEVEKQLKALKGIAPLAKRVGVIYNPKNANIINKAKDIARNLGLEIVAIEAHSLADVNEGIRRLAGRIDAFWMIIDPLLANRAVFKRLLLFTLSERIPLIVPAGAFVEAGGLFAVDVDYKGIGKQAAEIANEILAGTNTPETIGIEYPRDTNLVINLKTAKTIGLSIPPSVVEEATKLYK